MKSSPITWKPGLEAIGTARALQGVELAVETAGIVKDVLFQANDEVKAGQHLAQLDDAIEAADLAASQAELDLAETQLERARELRQRGVTAINDLDVAQASESSAQSQVVKLTAVMNQKSLEAPFAGTIGIPQVDVGEYVIPGTVYATLQDLDNMRVDFSVPEQEIRLVAFDLPVTVSTEVGNTELTGHISAIEPRIDPNSRLVTVRAEVDDPAPQHQSRPVPAGARRAARGAERDRAAADRAQHHALRRFRLRGPHRRRGRRRQAEGRAGLRQGRASLAGSRRDRRGAEARRAGGDRRAKPVDRRRVGRGGQFSEPGRAPGAG